MPWCCHPLWQIRWLVIACAHASWMLILVRFVSALRVWFICSWGVAVCVERGCVSLNPSFVCGRGSMTGGAPMVGVGGGGWGKRTDQPAHDVAHSNITLAATLVEPTVLPSEGLTDITFLDWQGFWVPRRRWAELLLLLQCASVCFGFQRMWTAV
jgi:hypothetical protein